MRKARLAEAADDRSLAALTPGERATLGELLTKVVFRQVDDPAPGQ